MQTAERKWDPAGNPDRRRRKMAQIDELPSDLRACVHDLGWNVVKQFMLAGIVDAKTMRHLVHTIRHEDKPAWLRGSWNDH